MVTVRYIMLSGTSNSVGGQVDLDNHNNLTIRGTLDVIEAVKKQLAMPPDFINSVNSDIDGNINDPTGNIYTSSALVNAMRGFSLDGYTVERVV